MNWAKGGVVCVTLIKRKWKVKIGSLIDVHFKICLEKKPKNRNRKVMLLLNL